MTTPPLYAATAAGVEKDADCHRVFDVLDVNVFYVPEVHVFTTASVDVVVRNGSGSRCASISRSGSCGGTRHGEGVVPEALLVPISRARKRSKAGKQNRSSTAVRKEDEEEHQMETAPAPSAPPSLGAAAAEAPDMV
uniref:Uncharacterized protein OJ1080_F08.104 n=2 Tax=Oryza sativa subsp. japonica TaxID=39947 RepID=Q8GRP1_ORYSJ|nr:hypothetical protein [Oryza sativa Japonica Group]BAC20012.1 hypothetical protein [Oryza sativa Japonica Group]